MGCLIGLIRSVFRELFRSLRIALRLTWELLKFLFPRMIRGMIRVIELFIEITLIAMAAVWTGIPPAIEGIVEIWMEDNNEPEGLQRIIAFVLRVIATLVIIAGWIVLAHLTVWVVGYIIASV